MSRDWARLAAAIRAARQSRGWTQSELADAAGVGFSTVQRIESGRPYTRTPGALLPVVLALGWTEESADLVLAGGEPVDKPAAAETRPHYADGMPLRIVQELGQGRVVDTDVLDLTVPGSDMRMIVVVKQGATEATPDQMREQLAQWSRMQRAMRRIASAPDDAAADGA